MPPRRVALRVVHLQLGMRATLPLALAELDEAPVRLIQRLGDRLGGLKRARERRADYASGALGRRFRDPRCEEPGLAQPIGRKRRIEMPLEAPFAVPVGDAVANEKEATPHRAT